MHPDVAQLLGQGPPAAIQVNPADHPDNQASATSFEDAVASKLDEIRQLIANAPGDVDPKEKLALEQITTQMQKLLADRHAQQQAALGGGPATQFLKRASGTG